MNQVSVQVSFQQWCSVGSAHLKLYCRARGNWSNNSFPFHVKAGDGRNWRLVSSNFYVPHGHRGLSWSVLPQSNLILPFSLSLQIIRHGESHQIQFRSILADPAQRWESVTDCHGWVSEWVGGRDRGGMQWGREIPILPLFQCPSLHTHALTTHVDLLYTHI